MKINRITKPYPAVYIEDFFPNESLLRAASESFNDVLRNMNHTIPGANIKVRE